jgi:hypothetical protein
VGREHIDAENVWDWIDGMNGRGGEYPEEAAIARAVARGNNNELEVDFANPDKGKRAACRQWCATKQR